MGRWEPGSRGRLEQAALELFDERGFESTTVAAIAERAGLTERTFFRHFTDKREVLFWGAGSLQDLLVSSVDAAPATEAPLDAIVAALRAAAEEFFDERGEHARRRQAVIDANPELQEREIVKMARLAAALADALRRRGVGDPTASLAAEAGITAFRIGFETWVHDDAEQSLSEAIQATADELRLLTGAPGPKTRRRR
ncbi:TetR family transcriptional regulator [soil metagenome]